MNEHAKQVIDEFGGVSAVARMFGISAPSVIGWKRQGIPDYRMRSLVEVHAERLRGIDLEAATSPVRRSHLLATPVSPATAPATQEVSHG